MTAVPLSMRPDHLTWKDQTTLPHGARIAVLIGDPSGPGRYVVRLRVPAGHRVMPHTHPDERVYTVLSGTFYLGFGEYFLDRRLEEWPKGSVILVPAGLAHFQSADLTEYEVQIDGDGPTAADYVHSGDDPRGPRPLSRA